MFSSSQPAWLDQDNSNSPASQAVSLFAGNRRRKLCTTVFLTCTLLFLVAHTLLGFGASQLPHKSPVYCSTWDSATEIFPEYRETFLQEYDAWCLYNKSRAAWHADPLKSPQTLDMPVARGIFDSDLSNKPKNMAGQEFQKPKGFKIVAMIFCKPDRRSSCDYPTDFCDSWTTSSSRHTRLLPATKHGRTCEYSL